MLFRSLTEELLKILTELFKSCVKLSCQTRGPFVIFAALQWSWLLVWKRIKVFFAVQHALPPDARDGTIDGCTE